MGASSMGGAGKGGAGSSLINRPTQAAQSAVFNRAGGMMGGGFMHPDVAARLAQQQMPTQAQGVPAWQQQSRMGQGGMPWQIGGARSPVQQPTPQINIGNAGGGLLGMPQSQLPRPEIASGLLSQDPTKNAGIQNALAQIMNRQQPQMLGMPNAQPQMLGMPNTPQTANGWSAQRPPYPGWPGPPQISKVR